MTASSLEHIGVFDLETTGVDVETARIVSAFVGVIDGSGQAKGVAWLADPGVDIPPGASAVHGITTERARAEGRPAVEVIAEIIEVLRALLAQGVPITIYNAPYDLTLLAREAARYGIAPLEEPAPIIDPLVLDKATDRFRKGKRTLESAAAFYGVDLSDAHDATADAVAAGLVARAILSKHADALGNDLAVLHARQADWSAEQAASFEDYMRRTKNPDFSAEGGWPVR